jgi:hypothetical protein
VIEDTDAKKVYYGLFASCSSDPNSQAHREQIEAAMHAFQDRRGKRAEQIMEALAAKRKKRRLGTSQSTAFRPTMMAYADMSIFQKFQYNNNNFVIAAVDLALRKALTTVRSYLCVGELPLTSTSTSTSTSGSSQGEPNGQIKARHGKCLHASQRNKNGGNVHMWHCDPNNKDQQWTYTSGTGVIKARHGKCLDASQRNKNGGKVHMWHCDPNNKNQQWACTNCKPTSTASIVGDVVAETSASYLTIWDGIGSEVAYQGQEDTIKDTLLRLWRENMESAGLVVDSVWVKDTVTREGETYQKLAFKVKKKNTMIWVEPKDATSITKKVQYFLLIIKKDCSTQEFMQSGVEMADFSAVSGGSGFGGALLTSGSFTLMASSNY